MTTIPELIQSGCLSAGFGQEGGIKGKDSSLLQQGTVQGLKQELGLWIG
jgi:hypothetical protein